MSFGNLQKYKADLSVTRKITFNELLLNGESPVSLTVRSAGKENVAYQNALSVEMNDVDNDALEGRNSSPEKAVEVLRRQCVLISQHVIVGWENVVNEEGKEVNFSPEKCSEFLIQLLDVDYAFITKIVKFVADRKNFTKDKELTDQQIKNTAKN